MEVVVHLRGLDENLLSITIKDFDFIFITHFKLSFRTDLALVRVHGNMPMRVRNELGALQNRQTVRRGEIP